MLLCVCNFLSRSFPCPSDTDTKQRQSLLTAQPNSRETSRPKARTCNAKTHSVNQVVSDVEHLSKTHPHAQRYTSVHVDAVPPQLSSHPPRSARPSRISKKNRLAMHDAAPRSEMQPAHAGSKSGKEKGWGGEYSTVKGVSTANLQTCGKKT